MKSKKGMENTQWVVVTFAIALLAFVIVSFIFGRGTGNFSEQTASKFMQTKLDACEAEQIKAEGKGMPWPDRDKDGYPDHCDNCPDTPNAGVYAQYTEDTDGDRFYVLKEKDIPSEYKGKFKECCITYESGWVLKGTKTECEEDDKEYSKELVSIFLYKKRILS